MDSSDYLQVLETIQALPFPLGRKALVAFLTGSDNDTVKRNRLHKETRFACLSGYSREETQQLLSWMLTNGLIASVRPQGKFFRVIDSTQKGQRELAEPTLDRTDEMRFTSSPITEEDRKVFRAFDFFLKRYNDEQKKAITSRAKHILCVAGAGSGKTTVLTKRIEFLVRFCGVPREKILAITFTRKAREEMQRRLQHSVQVETFNSFCEKLLSKHGQRLYGKPVNVIRYGDRVRLLHHAVKKLGLDLPGVIAAYFTPRQRKEKSTEQLARLFLNDCFSILDYYANNNKELEDFSAGSPDGKMVYAICRSIRQEMKEIGLRDYADQLTDGLALLRQHPEIMPRYEHVLVDEYQDVNTVQQELLDTLRPGSLFAVGDPRQSIFGWRGSSIQCILDFPGRYAPCETIVLTKNYRSGEKIVRLANASISRMCLPDIESARESGTAHLHSFTSDDDELKFLVQKVLASSLPREEIFVLTRTNRQLQAVSDLFKARDIPHVLRNDEAVLREAGKGEVTLSTVHAIKGLEAEAVFLAFANAQSFPCVASDHQVLELVKRAPLDREAEELRLFYVAVTRAKTELHISYSGTPTKFITREAKQLLGASYDADITAYKAGGNAVFQRLRAWRTETSRRTGLPPYMIFSDKTLIELAQQQPGALAELHGITGIGPAKAQKYGEELLTLLNG